MDSRSMTEEDEAIMTLPGLSHGCLPNTHQSAIDKEGGGGSKEDNKEEDSNRFKRMMVKAVAALAKRRRVQ
jgi:hypothetical protein